MYKGYNLPTVSPIDYKEVDSVLAKEFGYDAAVEGLAILAQEKLQQMLPDSPVFISERTIEPGVNVSISFVIPISLTEVDSKERETVRDNTLAIAKKLIEILKQTDLNTINPNITIIPENWNLDVSLPSTPNITAKPWSGSTQLTYPYVKVTITAILTILDHSPHIVDKFHRICDGAVRAELTTWVTFLITGSNEPHFYDARSEDLCQYLINSYAEYGLVL